MQHSHMKTNAKFIKYGTSKQKLSLGDNAYKEETIPKITITQASDILRTERFVLPCNRPSRS